MFTQSTTLGLEILWTHFVKNTDKFQKNLPHILCMAYSCTGFTSLCLTSFFSVDHLPCIYAWFLILFHLTQVRFSQSTHLLMWCSLHARLNSYYEAWSYKKSTKKITGYISVSVQKEPTVKRCLLILDFKPLRSQV